MSITNQVNIIPEEETTSRNIDAVNSQQDINDIRNTQQVNDEIIICTATKAELFYTDKLGFTKMLNSCGECDECGHIFHESYLYSYDGLEKASWPVFYEGRYCKDCWLK